MEILFYIVLAVFLIPIALALSFVVIGLLIGALTVIFD